MTPRRACSLALLLTACGGRGPAPPPVGATGIVEAPRVTPGNLDVQPLLGDLPQKAQSLGAGPVAIVTAGPLGEGERVGAFVDVPKSVCLLFYARSSASLEDVDLAAFADEGNPLAADETRDAKPTLLVCPPHPDRVYVAVHAAAGEGLCVVAAQLVPRDKADAVGRAVGARGAAEKRPETWPGLDEVVRRHRGAIGGTWEEVRRVAVPVDARAPSAVAFQVEEGGCSDAVIVPDDDVAALDVDVLDGEGRLVGRAREGTPARAVTVCSSRALTGSLQVRPHVGTGFAAVVIGKSKGDGARDLMMRPEIVWGAPNLPLDQARSGREQLLAKAGYGGGAALPSGQLTLGRRVTQTIDLGSAGSCLRLDVVGGAPLALVDAAVWDDGGALLASGEGADGAVLFACGKGKARVDLGTRGRPGPYAVLTRPERWRDPAFVAHPLASSRMLTRLLAGVVHEGKPGTVRSALLEPTKRHVQDANIAAGQCLAVAAGVAGDGTGLELRLFDAVSGEELDRSHGQTAAGVKACAATAAARSVRVEARATAGRLDAVIGERVTGAR